MLRDIVLQTLRIVLGIQLNSNLTHSLQWLLNDEDIWHLLTPAKQLHGFFSLVLKAENVVIFGYFI